jgi:hypothetical protein
MEPNLSLKTWPDVDQFDKVINDTLQTLSLSNLENEYTETSDGKDTWTLRDPKAKTDIICIVVDGDLNLHIEPLEPAPILDWLTEQLATAFQDLKDVLAKDKTTNSTYLQWCMTNRPIGPTLEMAQKQLADERDRSKYPSLAPVYPK